MFCRRASVWRWRHTCDDCNWIRCLVFTSIQYLFFIWRQTPGIFAPEITFRNRYTNCSMQFVNFEFWCKPDHQSYILYKISNRSIALNIQNGMNHNVIEERGNAFPRILSTSLRKQLKMIWMKRVTVAKQSHSAALHCGCTKISHFVRWTFRGMQSFERAYMPWIFCCCVGDWFVCCCL